MVSMLKFSLTCLDLENATGNQNAASSQKHESVGGISFDKNEKKMNNEMSERNSNNKAGSVFSTAMDRSAVFEPTRGGNGTGWSVLNTHNRLLG